MRRSIRRATWSRDSSTDDTMLSPNRRSIVCAVNTFAYSGVLVCTELTIGMS